MSTKDKSTTIGDRPKIERLFLGVGTGAGYCSRFRYAKRCTTACNRGKPLFLSRLRRDSGQWQ